MQTSVRCPALRTGMIGGGGLDDEAAAGNAAPPSNPHASTHARNALRTSAANVPFDLAAKPLI